jgi:hypothetical protein
MLVIQLHLRPGDGAYSILWKECELWTGLHYPKDKNS